MDNSESQKHHNLKMELVAILEKGGNRINAIDGYTENSPKKVKNKNEVGDGEDKIPDIDAFDKNKKQYIRGEAKIGDGDIEALRSITQYRLFSNLYNRENKKSSLLYIIIPASHRNDLKDVLINNVPKKNWKNIKMIQSSKYSN